MAISTAIAASARARALGIKTDFKDLRGGRIALLPQRVAVIGQGAIAATYTNDKQVVTSSGQVGETYGFGSPLHLAVKELLPDNGDGVGIIPVTVYPLNAEDGSPVAGSITPTGTATADITYFVRINGSIDTPSFIIAEGETVLDVTLALTTAINATLDSPLIAVDGTTVTSLTSKWDGATGNDITFEIFGSITDGITFVNVQPTGGTDNPTVDDALAQLGDVWETLIVDCLGTGDTTSLDEYQSVGEGRWLPEVRKPFIAFSGSNVDSFATAIVVPDARKTDRINSQIVAPGSPELPWVIAARGVSRIAALANSNPPHDYGSQDLSGIVPGSDAVQWTAAEREAALQGGSSTSRVIDGVINLSDTVTFYHPVAEEPDPAYRFVVDVIKIMNILYNVQIIFATPEWDGAPLIPDDQPTTNRSAKKPKTAKMEIATMIDNLGLEAIISDPEAAKESILTEISASNPKRLDATFTVQLSGNTNIISIDFNFGFFFGTTSLAA